MSLLHQARSAKTYARNLTRSARLMKVCIMASQKIRLFTIVLLLCPAIALAREPKIEEFRDSLATPTVDISGSANSTGRAQINGGAIAVGNVELNEAAPVQQSTAIAMGEYWSTLSASACENVLYRPTWWLPQSVEVRRAIYYPAMAQVACEFAIPIDLMDAVIAQESGYNPYAVSRAGAMGMMQIMPGTARNLGLLAPWDAMANMRSGARYFRTQLDRFGAAHLALAAYNAGPERRSLAFGRIPSIPETLSYVRSITTNWARLAAETPTQTAATARARAANLAIKAAGYREVDLSVYEGINASNPI